MGFFSGVRKTLSGAASGFASFAGSAVSKFGGTAAKALISPGAALTEATTGISMVEQARIGASVGAAVSGIGMATPPEAAPAIPQPVSRPGFATELTAGGSMPFDLGAITRGITAPGGFGSQVLTQIALPALAQRFLPSARTQTAPSMMPVPASMPGAQPAAAGVARGALTGVRLILAKASAWLGKRVTRKNVVRLTKQIGVEAAAVALGITVAEVAFVMASAPTRRARGISASDIRRTKGTLRKLSTMACNFQEYCSTSKSLPRRKKVCR